MSDNSMSFDKLKADLTTEIGRQRDTRYEMTFESVFAMSAGIIMAFAVLLLASDSASDSGSTPIVWSIVGIAGAYAAVKYLGDALQAGAVTMVTPLVIVGGGYMMKSSLGDGKYGMPLLVIGAVFAAMWALPILRGRPTLLAMSLFFVGSGLVTLVNQGSISDDLCYSYDSSYDSWGAGAASTIRPVAFRTALAPRYCSTSAFDIANSTFGNTSTIALLLGVAMLIAAFRFDKKGWPNVAKPFIGVGLVFELVGVIGVATSQSDATLASFMVIASGVLLIVVGLGRARRATLIFGGLSFAMGVIALLNSMFGSDGATTFAIVCAAVAAGIGYLVAKKSDDVKAKMKIG